MPSPISALKGLYSRVDDIVSKFPAKINPNRAMSALKSGASKDEISYRGLSDLLTGSDPIERAAIQEHLTNNPIDLRLVRRTSNADAELGTKYAQYQMPGGEDYGEDIIQINKPMPEKFVSWRDDLSSRVEAATGREFERTNAQDLLNRGFDDLSEELQRYNDEVDMEADVFRGPHFGEPDAIVHTRYNNRNLPGAEVPYNYRVEPFQGDEWNDAQQYPYQILSDKQDSYHALATSPEEAQEWITKGYFGDGPPPATFNQPGPKGRMLENVQSDWHQKGAQSGYKTPEDIAKLKASRTRELDLEKILRGKRPTVVDHLRSVEAEGGSLHDILHDLTNRGGNWADNPYFDANRLAPMQRNDLEEFINLRNELYDIQYKRAREHDLVPDAPFKDSWPSLALKQQIMDVVDKPDLEWIGIAPADQLRARGEVIGPDFQDKRLPLTLEKILKPFGGKLEDVDLGPTAQTNRPQFNWDPYVGRYGGFQRTPGNVGGLQEEDVLSALPGADRSQLLGLLQSQVPNPRGRIVRITPEMKQQIKEKGLPLLALMALAPQMYSDQ